MASIQKRPDGRYRARYRDHEGKEHARHFALKREAQDWLDEETTKLNNGTWVLPKQGKATLNDWCDIWLKSQQTNRASTHRQANTHVVRIRSRFGKRRMSMIKPLDVEMWMGELRMEGLAQSTRYALYSRLRQIYAAAIENGIVGQNPCVRRVSPGMGSQRPYVATVVQVKAIAAAMPESLRPAIWLAAYAGLRIGEVCGLRVKDVDFMRGMIHVRQQYPDLPLKSESSGADVPIPSELAHLLAAHVAEYSTEWILTNEWGKQAAPWVVARHFKDAASRVNDTKAMTLPEGFRFHDLRHFYGSLLIASGLDVKTVQARMRHASATTTLNVYGHMFPDTDDATRNAVGAILGDSADYLRTRKEVNNRNA